MTSTSDFTVKHTHFVHGLSCQRAWCTCSDKFSLSLIHTPSLTRTLKTTESAMHMCRCMMRPGRTDGSDNEDDYQHIPCWAKWSPRPRKMSNKSTTCARRLAGRR